MEKNALRTLCLGQGYAEVHHYIWYDAAWNRTLGYVPGPGIELRNPAAAGQEMLRHTLLPGLLAAVDRNRLYEDVFKLCEIGSVFNPTAELTQHRSIGLVSVQRGKKVEDELFSALKGDLETWAWQTLDRPVEFRRPALDDPAPPWVHPQKTAEVWVDDRRLGLVSVVPMALRRAIDEHLGPWGIAWAELDLTPLAALPPADRKLRRIPEYPEVDLDFSMIVPATVAYGQVNAALARLEHPLLRRISYVTSFEGGSLPPGKRSLTYRTRLGADDRTLSEEDLTAFRQAFRDFIVQQGFEMR
jgi:phenylalanyl-tRNA synthetase beta chain